MEIEFPDHTVDKAKLPELVRYSLECCICLNYLEDATECIQCSNMCCAKCFDVWTITSSTRVAVKKCPFRCVMVAQNSIRENHAIRKMISKLPKPDGKQIDLAGINLNSLAQIVRDFVLCQKCNKFLKNAVYTECCNDLYCHDCLLPCQNSSSKECPKCHITVRVISKNPVIQRLTDSIPVRCCYLNHGCTSIPTIGDFDTHIATCRYKNPPVKCPYKYRGCGSTLTSDEIDAHVASCIYKNAPIMIPTISDPETFNKELSDLDSQIKSEPETALVQCHILLERIIDCYGEMHRFTAICYKKIGFVMKKLAYYETSIENYRRAINSMRTADDKDPEVCSCFIQLADVKRKMDDNDGAMMDFQTALTYVTSGYDLFVIKRGIGLIYKKNGEYRLAMRSYDEARIAIETVDSEEERIHMHGILDVDVGDVHRKKGEYTEALAFYDTAIQRLSIHESSLDLADAYISQSLALIGDSQRMPALAAVTRADEIASKMQKVHYKKGIALAVIGYIYGQLKQYDRSFPNMEMGLNILSETLGAQHLEVADTRLKIVEIACNSYQEESIGDHKLDSFMTEDKVREHVDLALKTYQTKYPHGHMKIDDCCSFAAVIDLRVADKKFGMIKLEVQKDVFDKTVLNKWYKEAEKTYNDYYEFDKLTQLQSYQVLINSERVLNDEIRNADWKLDALCRDINSGRFYNQTLEPIRELEHIYQKYKCVAQLRTCAEIKDILRALSD